MRSTPTIVVDDELVLRPAGKVHFEQLVTAFTESWPEVLQALPWYEIDLQMESQLSDYLDDVQRIGRIGVAHHWAVIDRGDESLLGLIAFDRTTRTKHGEWNLGYWVVRGSTGRGIASRCTDKALEWISTAQGGPTAVEITFDPSNEAGSATAASIVRKWNGRRAQEGDGLVIIGGESIEHVTYLIPRLPINAKSQSSKPQVWLSLDTDDECHHPRQSGHPTRSRQPESTTTYKMSERLNSAWDSFSAWRADTGNGIPITLFVISDQLDDDEFSTKLLKLLDSDTSITVACHGLSHRCWSAWPEDRLALYRALKAARDRLQEFAGDAFRPWFRAPAGYIAPWMAEVLKDTGFILDSSVNPTSLLAGKAGPQKNWSKVVDAMMAAGIVERQWLTAGKLPVCGPALHLPFLGGKSRRVWSRATKNAEIVSESVLLDSQQQVISLYWHLIDHARKSGKWRPPLHEQLNG